MGLLGFDWFETKTEKKIRIDAYNHFVYPFGEKQKDLINELLKQLFKKEKIEESTYNYIVTKQALMKTPLNSLDSKKLKDLINTLEKSFVTFNSDVVSYIVLADIDLNIDDKLDYPHIEVIQNRINKYKQSL